MRFNLGRLRVQSRWIPSTPGEPGVSAPSQDRRLSVPAISCYLRRLYVQLVDPLNPTRLHPGASISRRLPRLLPIIAAFAALSVGGCSGDSGLVDLAEGGAVERIEVHAPAGTVHIIGNDDTAGIAGTHSTHGFGARGPAKVHLDADGVMHIDVPCAPLLPCSLDLSLAVSPSTDVVVDLGSGAVTVEGLDSADIQLDRGDVVAKVSSELVVRVGQGSLQATTLAESHVQAVVASGDVELSVPPGGWRVDAAAARLQMSGVAMDRRAAGQLSVHAPSGAVRIVGSDSLASR